MIIQSPRRQLYYIKGKGIGSFLKSLVQPGVIKGHLKTVGKLLLEKAKSVARDVLQPTLKQAAIDVGQLATAKAKEKLKNVLSPQKVETTMANLASKTQQPFVKEAIQKLTPTISDASKKLLSNLLAGSGLTKNISNRKWKPPR